MKSQAAILLKQMAAAVAALLKRKSTAARSRAVAMRARLLIFKLLRSRKVMLAALSAKMQSVTESKEIELGEASCRSIELLFHEANEGEELQVPAECYTEDLLECVEDDDGDNLKEEEEEEEIDHAAAVFIERFRRQMRMEEYYCIERQRKAAERSWKKMGRLTSDRLTDSSGSRNW